MASDASEVDAALLAVLSSDTTLARLMPDGVCIDVADSGKTKFVILSLLAHDDNYMFGGEAYERSLYLVKAVQFDDQSETLAVKTAAARIHTLLQDQPLTISGYSHMLTQREERIRHTEVDAEEPEHRWHHRGGHYTVFVSPTA